MIYVKCSIVPTKPRIILYLSVLSYFITYDEETCFELSSILGIEIEHYINGFSIKRL